MDALILSCSTGGGHNAAGFAIKEELEYRGHRVTMMDPYELVSHKLATDVGNVYVKMVQRSPKLFGFIYSLGSLVRKVPGKSPVYYANIAVAKKLSIYLREHPVDVILMPHLYPAELITYLKKRGEKLPLSVFIATDYVCIPFTEETDCDYYVVPGKAQVRDFVKRGIPKEKILPYGIPVDRKFDTVRTEAEDGKLRAYARKSLGLDQNRKYILLTGGSIGAGNMVTYTKILWKWFRKRKISGTVIVVCGNNEKLYTKMQNLKKKHKQDLMIIKKTDQMANYMYACDIFMSKPGGLSSTEAAVANVPYIHMKPIPGCESKNIKYFSKNGMSYAVCWPRLQLMQAMDQLADETHVKHMKDCQKKIPADARRKICDWVEEFITT